MKYGKRKIFLDWCLNWRRIQAATLVVLLFPLASWAETVEVVASGMGMTADAATKAALRSAVEQVVGQLVDANTLVANEDVVSDKILTYSGGYVEGYEAIKDPTQGSDGLYSTKIKARVKKTALVEKLRAENVTRAEVSGTSLFAQMTTKTQQAEDAGAILADDFKDIPVKLLTVAVAKKSDGMPDLVLNENTGEVSVNIVLQVDANAYNNWLKAVLPKLDAMADAKHQTLLGFRGNNGDPYLGGIIPKGLLAPETQPEVNERILCFEIERSPDCRTAQWCLYKFRGSKADAVDKMLKHSLNETIAIEARMVDAMGRLLGGNIQREYICSGVDGVVCYNPGSKEISFGPSTVLKTYFLGYRDEFMSVNKQRAYRTGWELYGPCGAAMQFKMTLGIFTPEQIKAASTITCSVSGI